MAENKTVKKASPKKAPVVKKEVETNTVKEVSPAVVEATKVEAEPVVETKLEAYQVIELPGGKCELRHYFTPDRYRVVRKSCKYVCEYVKEQLTR